MNLTTYSQIFIGPTYHRITPIPFMGVGFSENGPSDPRISKALEKTYALLDIMEFVKVTKFELNEVILTIFGRL
jgi:hypothetical protein